MSLNISEFSGRHSRVFVVALYACADLVACAIGFTATALPQRCAARCTDCAEPVQQPTER